MSKKMGRPRKRKSQLSQGVCVTLYPEQIKYIEKIGKGNRSQGIRKLVEDAMHGQSSD